MPTILARDDQGRVIDWETPEESGGDAGPHDHNEYATDADLSTHAATPHGGEAGPHTHAEYVETTDTRLSDARDPTAHTHDTYATDADLTTHAGTAHGLSAHAIDGVYHTGSEVLPTTGQKNALAGTTGTPGTNNRYVTDTDTRLSDARTPTSHSHLDGDLPAGIARDSEVTAAIATHAATPHGGGSGEVYAVGDIYITKRAGDPATLLGYGTWAALGNGRLLMASDTAGQTGGSSTHTHAAHSGVINHTHPVTDPGHAHLENSNNATTGPLRGWGAADTSTNTETATGYSTASATTGVTTANPAGGVAELTHDSPSHLPPYFTVHVWERTA